jgi:hypothetical protein
VEVHTWASLLVMVSANSMPWLAASQGQKLCHELRWLYSSNRHPVHRRHSSCRQPLTADSALLSLIRALVIPFTTVLKTAG